MKDKHKKSPDAGTSRGKDRYALCLNRVHTDCSTMLEEGKEGKQIMNARNYIAIGFAAWLWLHTFTGRGALLELAALLLFWPLVAAAALAIELMCGVAWMREQIAKRWKRKSRE